MEPQNAPLMSSNMLEWFLSTLTPTPAAESHMPSTAEIIQKCLNINPFDMKFREANMQISGQTPESEQRGGQLTLPTTPGSIMLKLPTSINQSPSIFSNVLSAAEIEGEIRKNLDFTRKVQQLRDASLVKQEGNRTPCTADVLNAVLDMNMNQTITIPSTSSLVAGLTAAATTNSTNNTSTTSAVSSIAASCSSTVAPTSIPGLLASTSNDQPDLARNLGFTFTAPTTTSDMSVVSSSLSQANLAATTAALLHQHQQTTLANMISCQQNSLGNSLNPINNQSMPNLHSGFQSTNNNSAPASNALTAPRASPALNQHSPRSTSHLTELQKSNAADAHRAASVDPWDANSEVKPIINKSMPSYLMYESLHGRLELKTDSFSSGLNAPASSEDSSIGSQPNSHMGETESTKPHRKYARYHNPGNDGQFPSSRGGRGRRSLTSEMPPDERRMTILERNKAAAVRYRKRKKEEHDDMIGRVGQLEQDKVFIQTQNAVYKREIDRLTELLKIRDSRCVCQASQDLPIFNSDSNRGHNDSDKMNGHQAGSSHLNGGLKHGNQMHSQQSLIPQ